MIEWVYRAAQQADATEVVVATDDQRIVDVVEGFGGNACMTDNSHRSGTDRILEVTRSLNWDKDCIVVNLQGDEPLMPAVNITQVAANLAAKECAMATLHKEIDESQAQDPNLVKLVHDHQGHAFALYDSTLRVPLLVRPPRGAGGRRHRSEMRRRLVAEDTEVLLAVDEDALARRRAHAAIGQCRRN